MDPSTEPHREDLEYQDVLNYECAIETINNLSAIYTAKIWKEENKRKPDKSLLALMNAEFNRLSDESQRLRIEDRAEIERIRTQYGRVVREYRVEGNKVKVRIFGTPILSYGGQLTKRKKSYVIMGRQSSKKIVSRKGSKNKRCQLA